MKADRFIYLLIILLLISACRQRINQKAYLPDWQAPQGPNVYYVLPQEIDQLPSREIVQAMPEAEAIIQIHRDTINGIAIRAPKSISIPHEYTDIEERHSGEEAQFTISYSSTNRYIAVNFDNDIFNNTDYYYTNGIKIDYIAPIFASSPLAYPMLPYRKGSMNYHGMTVVQNMYTPTNPDTSSIINGDHPFAAYLYLGHFKNTLSIKRRYRQFSEIQIGLIGPGSLGGLVQGQIHDIPPRGWENQIQNDIVLNYTAIVEKGIINPKLFDLNLLAEGQIGTLYDNLGGGLHTRIGKLNPYFAMPGLAKGSSAEGEHQLKWQYGIFAKAKATLVIYNATIQGGMFNKNSNYTIPAKDIERFVLEASAGIFLAYKQLGLTLEQFYVGPKFKDAYHFRWGHINLTYCF